MLKAMGWLIKLTLFAIVVLVLGNWVRFGGKTVNDQVQTHLSHAERSDAVTHLRKWAGDVTDDARTGLRKGVNKSQDMLPASERQKLRELIRDLNGPTEPNR